MVFSSYIFIFYFLPAVLAVYYLSPRRLKHLGLAVFSYWFYGWANPFFVLLILFSTAVDYLCGLTIAQVEFGERGKTIQLLSKNGQRFIQFGVRSVI